MNDLYDQNFETLKFLTPHNMKTGVEHLNKELLLSLVERIEKLNEDLAGISADIKGVYQEAISQGFDPKYIRKCIALRKKDKDQLDEEDELIKLYREVLGI